jgi:APA family basic amino acid/polyamine antiporter
VISSVIITFFAFWGFEGIVNLSEETKNPKKTVPRALMLSIIISTILYVLVALTAISVVGWEKLAASKAPLADVARTAIPDLDLSLLLSVIALFATSNTVLVSLILSSRALYGIASDNSLPPVFSRIHVKRKTPYIAVFTVMILMMIAASFQDLKMVATLADAAIFTTYFAVNICLIWLRFSEPKADRPFKAPLSIGRMPLLALVGAASILILMALYVEPIFLLAEAGIVIVGYLIHRASRKKI